VPSDSDGIKALALHFAGQGHDPLLYDPQLTTRPAFVVDLVKSSGAAGVVILMMQFCDPEELEYPSLKKALDEAGIPSAVIGFEQQMKDFAQAGTQLQAFADVLSVRKN
jgi:benzoyl-CoA reductase/2-hydroxyglutaryl-CoA dehydratase subunit BcrC/BadD/HgdB